VRITPKFEYQELTGITKYYYVNGVRVPNAPFQTGEFDVEFDVAAAGNYKAVQGLKAGTLKIAAGTGASEPAWNDFTYDGLGNYNFDWEKARIVSVIPNNIADSGPVTVKYYQANRYPLGQVSEDIKNVGTYDVYFSVGASITKLATSNDILAGQLTIEPRIPSAEDFEWNMPKVWTYDGDVRDMAAPDSNGHSQYITSKKLGDISAGLLDIYYNGSKTLPRDAGEYVVTFNLAAAANWERASNLTFGTLTILQNTPKGDNFTVAVPAPKTYDGLAASPAIVSTVGAMAVPDGTVTVLYKGSAAAPINAGTYDITIDIAESKNWLGKTGLIPQPQQNLVIYKRDPVEADFNLTSGSLNAKAYSDGVKIVLAANQSRFPAFPTTPVPKVEWAASGSGTYSATPPTAAGTYSVRITVTEPTAEPANWNGAVFYWTQTVENQEFASVNEFRQWLARQTTSSSSSFYYAKFKNTLTLTKEGAGSNGIGGDSFLNLAIYLKDNPNLITTGNTINNMRKRVFLDLSDCTVSESIDLSTPYATTPAAGVLDDDHVAANAVPDADPNKKWKYAAFTGFEGCTNLVGLKLPHNKSGSGAIIVGDDTFGKPSSDSAIPSTVTVNLGELDLGIVTSLAGKGAALRYLNGRSGLRILNTGDLVRLTSGGDAATSSETTLPNLVNNVNITRLIVGGALVGGNGGAAAGIDAFKQNTYLQTLEFSDFKADGTTVSAAKLASYAFTGCSKLTSVKFPDTWAQIIPESAFDNCAVLNSVTFPTVFGPEDVGNNATSANPIYHIGKNAFRQTPALKTIKIDGINSLYNATAASASKAIIHDDAFGNALTSVVIKAVNGGYVDIGRPLKGKGLLETLELDLAQGLDPVPAPSVGNGIISNNPYNPGPQAFMGCANLKNVKIKNMNGVAEEAFRDCVSLSSIEGISNVPITTILWGAFAGTKSLKYLNLSQQDSFYVQTINGSSMDPFYSPGNALREPAPNNISVGYGDRKDTAGKTTPRVPGAFEGSGLKWIALTQYTFHIREEAFKDCKDLETVLWGGNGYPGAANGVIMEESAFEGCASLNTMGSNAADEYLYKDGVVMTPPFFIYEADVFKNCTGIREVKFYLDYMDYALSSTKDDLFNGCTGVKKITVTMSNSIVDLITATEPGVFSAQGGTMSDTTIGGAFRIKLPNVEEVVWDCVAVPPQTFWNVPNLKTLTFTRNLVEAVAGGAFWNNESPDAYKKTAPKLDTLKLAVGDQTKEAAFYDVPGVKTVVVGTRHGYKYTLESGTYVGGDGKENTAIAANLSPGIGFGPSATNGVGKSFLPPTTNYVNFQWRIGSVSTYAFQGLGSGGANPDYFDVRIGSNPPASVPNAGAGVHDTDFDFGILSDMGRTITLGPDVTSLGSGTATNGGDINFISSDIGYYIVEDGNKNFKADQGVLYQYNEHPVTGALLSTLKLVRYPPKRANPSYAIMDKVTAIDPDAFGTNTILKELTISKDIVSISSPGPKPFGGLGEQFTTVNWNAEKMSSELGSYDTSNGACFPASVTTFNLGNDVKEIPALLLNSANVNVTSLTIPEGVIKMEANSFSELLYLKKVIFNARYMDTAGSGAGSRFGVTGKLDSVTIGEKVENIPAYLFNSADFEKVILPDSLLYIRANAFQNNTALATITLPKNLKIIETAAFLDCERLSPVEILANGVSMALDSFVQIVSNSGIAQVGDDLKVLYDRFDGGAGKYYYISNNLTGTSASKGWEKRGN
jgi:hypothetical protein